MPKRTRYQQLGEETQRVMRFIQQHHAREGYVPSVREIGRGLGLCHNAAHYHLDRLAEAGYLRRRHWEARAYAIVRRVPDQEGDGGPADLASRYE